MGLPLEKFPDWPAAMDRDMALAYTSIADAQLKEWERTGRVRFRARGANGRMVALRSELDEALRNLFDNASDGGPDIEF